jgi:hypothetical protein
MMLLILPVILLTGSLTGPGIPAIIKYAPELCGMGASAFLVIYVVRHGFSKIRFVYWILIFLIALHLLFGILANEVKPGTVIIGGRLYLRTIPFFLLAIALTPSAKALKKQFLILLGVSLVQLPVSVYQKIYHYNRALTEGYITTTGDWVTGTLGHSGFLSLFLIFFSAVVITLTARKLISLKVTAVILLTILMPTMINETKATFFLAPMAIAIPMLIASGQSWVKNTAKSLLLLGGFLAVFIPVYDHFAMQHWGYGIVDFLTMEGRLEGYLSKDAEVGTTSKAGRLDAVTVAYEVLGKDPTSAVFGLGLGNTTESAFGRQYEGEYYAVYGAFARTTYGRLVWEIGFLGVLLVLCLLYLVFSDSRKIYKRPDAYGVLAHSYLAIVPIMVLAMLYKNLLLSPGISVCFWYYCGVLAAAAGQFAEPEKAAESSATHRPNRAPTTVLERSG